MTSDAAMSVAPRDYDPGASYDEAVDGSGELRPQYQGILGELSAADLEAIAHEIDDYVAERGIAFGGDEGHPFAVDPIPRILFRDEWAQLSDGIRQRVLALDAFTHDVYGERRAVAEGVVPEAVVSGSAYFEEDLRGIQPAAGARVSLTGLDVVRDSNGRFRILEDNVRTPSGLSYAMAASEAVGQALGRPRQDEAIQKEVAEALFGVLEASAPDIDGELVLLTDGPDNTAWYEHQRLAELAGLKLATPAEVRRCGTRLELGDGRPVRAVYRRTEEDRIRDESGELTDVADLLFQPLREGGVGLVNWFGNGVADDKNVYAYVDDLIRFYLGEEPVVPSVPTYDLTDPQRLEEVLDRLEDLVVKPRTGQGGDGVVVGATATPSELNDARAAIRQAPDDWIAQETVTLSTHPTVINGRLEPRHVDLRPFGFCDGQNVVVPPCALTRVAMQEGAMVVNSSRDGGGKATWIAD